MPNEQVKPDPKHLKGFWPIFIIVIVSMIAGGVIFFFAYGNIQQDEVNSINFLHPFSHTIKRTPSKTAPKTTTSTGTTTTK